MLGIGLWLECAATAVADSLHHQRSTRKPAGRQTWQSSGSTYPYPEWQCHSSDPVNFFSQEWFEETFGLSMVETALARTKQKSEVRRD
ncbi:hypothetical protein V1506DRAFT_534685 [Lipomyces tetrasporus]